MTGSLRIVRRRRSATTTSRPLPMSLGDVLYRISVISPRDYKALDALARARFKELWPVDEDVLLLKVQQG